MSEPVWGLLPLPDGFAYVKYEPYHSGRLRISFWLRSLSDGDEKQLKREQYLRIKFGESYKDIIPFLEQELLLRYQCSRGDNGSLLVNNPQTGDFILFAKNGTPLRQGSLLYNDAPITSLVYIEGSWWGICPQRNAVLQISSDWSWDFSAGGMEKNTFPSPTHLSAYRNRAGEKRLLVCCRGYGQGLIHSFYPNKQNLGLRNLTALPGYVPMKCFFAARQCLVVHESGIIAL
jgi:hypothetical protein